MDPGKSLTCLGRRQAKPQFWSRSSREARGARYRLGGVSLLAAMSSISSTLFADAYVITWNNGPEDEYFCGFTFDDPLDCSKRQNCRTGEDEECEVRRDWALLAVLESGGSPNLNPHIHAGLSIRRKVLRKFGMRQQDWRRKAVRDGNLGQTGNRSDIGAKRQSADCPRECLRRPVRADAIPVPPGVTHADTHR